MPLDVLITDKHLHLCTPALLYKTMPALPAPYPALNFLYLSLDPVLKQATGCQCTTALVSPPVVDLLSLTAVACSGLVHRYGSGAGGVAYVGTFGNAYYAPAYVFPAQLGNGNPKYVAEAISHEVGHNLGLSHDGQIDATGATVGYYEGQGSWAPIMGVGYYRPITHWSKGEYAGATQKQDDIAIIKSYIPALPADAGASAATATVLPVTVGDTSQTALVRGIIDGPANADW